jgi:hypothetical protein
MVDHDHDRVKAEGEGEVGYEVHRDLLEWPGSHGGKGGQTGGGGWVFTLWAWQTAQPMTNRRTNMFNPSHQKSQATRSWV